VADSEHISQVIDKKDETEFARRVASHVGMSSTSADSMQEPGTSVRLICNYRGLAPSRAKTLHFRRFITHSQWLEVLTKHSQ